MSTHTVPDTSVEYHLVRYDEEGAEVIDSDGTSASGAVLEAAATGVTDVFVLSHGWKGDVPRAVQQYDAWIGAMARQQSDRERMRAIEPDYKSLLVGLHWPSLPWGDESSPEVLLGPAVGDTQMHADDFAAEAAMDTGRLVDLYTSRLIDGGGNEAAVDSVRNALTTIIRAAEEPAVAERVARGELPEHLRPSYATLASVVPDQAGPIAAPGTDHADFDPQLTVEQWIGEVPTTGGDLLLGPLDGLAGIAKRAKDALLMPVRQLSFWTMKRRAVVVGERGMHELLRAIQTVAPDARIHLMGHSFGCIVVSSAIAGPVGEDGALASRLARPVDTLFLVQGAMSLWSFSNDIPFAPDSRGFFHVLLRDPSLVRGPIVTTRSAHDTAVGRFYPLGVRVVDDWLLGVDLPRFGGIGAWGIQGADARDVGILAATEHYGFSAGGIFNVEASRVIASGGGPSGAHSDINHDEVAHVMWQATAASVLGSRPSA